MKKIKKPQVSKGQYINGTWESHSGMNLKSYNPANNDLIWEGMCANDSELFGAFDAAKFALTSWAKLPASKRIQYMQDFAENITAKKEELAKLISCETGKPFWESLTEVNSVIAKVEISIKAYLERTGTKEFPSQGALGHLRYKPQGVVAVLGAFNFPAHLSNGHIIPALIAGNTIIYKPSEHTPAVAEFIIQCWHQAKLPAGVLNCIQGDAQVAKQLLKLPIQGIYFTGSYQTGLAIHKKFSERPEVILALEMGGNNPLLIDNEINALKAALYHTIISSFITAGQRCTCARRILIKNDSSGDQFLGRLIHLAQSIKVGPYDSEPQPFMGPVISAQQAKKLIEVQEQLKNSSGKILLQMEHLDEYSGFVTPGIIDMTQATSIEDTEYFGPIIQIYRYDDFEHALSIANNTQYGLAAGIITDNRQKYEYFYDTVNAGLINWNRPTTGAVSSLPFGGIGKSGNHRPSAFFAADYCAYPIASLEQPNLSLPSTILPGITL